MRGKHIKSNGPFSLERKNRGKREIREKKRAGKKSFNLHMPQQKSFIFTKNEGKVTILFQSISGYAVPFASFPSSFLICLPEGHSQRTAGSVNVIIQFLFLLCYGGRGRGRVLKKLG